MKKTAPAATARTLPALMMSAAICSLLFLGGCDASAAIGSLTARADDTPTTAGARTDEADDIDGAAEADGRADDAAGTDAAVPVPRSDDDWDDAYDDGWDDRDDSWDDGDSGYDDADDDWDDGDSGYDD